MARLVFRERTTNDEGYRALPSRTAKPHTQTPSSLLFPYFLNLNTSNTTDLIKLWNQITDLTHYCEVVCFKTYSRVRYQGWDTHGSRKVCRYKMETQSDKKWISLKESPLCDVLRASTIRMTVRFLWGPEGKLGFKIFDLQVSDLRVFQKYCWLCGASFSNTLFDFWCLSRTIRRTAQILDRRDSLGIWAVSDYICHGVLNLLKRKYHFKPWHIIVKVMFCVISGSHV